MVTGRRRDEANRGVGVQPPVLSLGPLSSPGALPGPRGQEHTGPWWEECARHNLSHVTVLPRGEAAQAYSYTGRRSVGQEPLPAATGAVRRPAGQRPGKGPGPPPTRSSQPPRALAPWSPALQRGRHGPVPASYSSVIVSKEHPFTLRNSPLWKRKRPPPFRGTATVFVFLSGFPQLPMWCRVCGQVTPGLTPAGCHLQPGAPAVTRSRFSPFSCVAVTTRCREWQSDRKGVR